VRCNPDGSRGEGTVGYTFDDAVAVVQLNGGRIWNATAKSCECPAGQSRDGSRCFAQTFDGYTCNNGSRSANGSSSSSLDNCSSPQSWAHGADIYCQTFPTATCQSQDSNEYFVEYYCGTNGWEMRDGLRYDGYNCTGSQPVGTTAYCVGPPVGTCGSAPAACGSANKQYSNTDTSFG
jgi:hypothetical protein